MKTKTARNFKTEYNSDGTITVWDLYSQKWIHNAFPSDLSDRIWASQSREEGAKWREHEKKFCHDL